MIDKDPTAWALSTWLLGFAMAIGGGLINLYSKIKQGHTKLFNLVEIVGEVFISGFVGIGSFMALAALGFPLGVCAFASGISGHMGARLLFLLEGRVASELKLKKENEDGA